MNNPLVSIIIPVFNEQKHVKACLKSIQSQTYPNLEVIVIDDGSTDHSKTIVNSFPQVKLLSQSHQGPGAARNLGAKKSRGDILVFVDADMKLHSKFVDKLTLPIRHGKIIGTFTKDERVANLTNPWAKSWSQIRGFKQDRMHPPNYPDQQPVFRAILKAKFHQAGGFDTNRGYDDDWSLSEKLGTLAQNAPGVIIYHHNPDSIPEIFSQARWMAKRRYKLGIIGKLGNLFLFSLPISKLKATYRLLKHLSIYTFFATFIFDLGITVGILETFVTTNTSR